MLALLGLIAFLGYLVATGTLKLYASTIGYFIRWLASKIDVAIGAWGVTVHPLRFLAHALLAVDETIRNALASAALEAEHGASWLFTTAGNIFAWTGHEIGNLAHDVLGTFQRVTEKVIPHAIHAGTAWVHREFKGIEHGIRGMRHLIEAEALRFAHGIDRLAHRLEHVITHDVARVMARVRAAERGIDRLEGRLEGLAAKLKTGAFTAAVALALTSILGNWIRCPSLRNIGRKVGCGGFGLLEDLLALTFVPFLLTDACQIVASIEALAIKVQPEIDALVLGIEGFVCGGTRNLPSAIEASDLKRGDSLPSGL